MTNQDRARAFFERLSGDGSANDLVAALIDLLDEAEARGPRSRLCGDPVALSLIQNTVRDQIAAVQGRGGILAFPKVALNDTAANIATAVAAALDNYGAPDAG